MESWPPSRPRSRRRSLGRRRSCCWAARRAWARPGWSRRPPRGRARPEPGSWWAAASSWVARGWPSDPAGARAAHAHALRHALTRDAMYGDTLARERARIHAAYGEVLSAEPALAGRDVSVPALLALHWTAAHDVPRALEASVEAARLAAPYAPAEALRHLERALELWPQVPDAAQRSGIDVVEAFRRAGVSAYAAGELERSLGLFDEALAELAPGAEPERRALLIEARAATLIDLGRDDEAQLELEGAAALLPDEPRGEAHAVVLTALVALRAVAGRFA